MVWLDNSRILAIFAVILLHVSSGIVLGNDVGTEYWWFGNLYDSIVRWCVPVFVMISGALLLDPTKQEEITFFYKKRLSKILVPIIAWSVFFSFFAFAKSIIKGDELPLLDLTKNLLAGNPHYHMWFLYMILSLYLFTPFFRKIVAHSSKNELLLFIAITFIMSALSYAYGKLESSETQLFTNWFLLYIPFFFAGYFIRQDDTYPSKLLLWSIFTTSFILTFLGCYFVAVNKDLSSGLYFYGYLSVTVIPMSISLMYILKTWDKPILNASFTKRLSILTFGIYLIHPVILDVINYKQYGAMSFHPLISIPVIALIVFIASACSAQIMSKLPYLKRTI